MERGYALNCDDYVFIEKGEPVSKLHPEVAVAFLFDDEDGLFTLVKHGGVESIRSWVNKNSKVPDSHEAFKVHLLEGKLPIAELNASLENHQHIGKLLNACLAIDSSKAPCLLNGVPLEANPNALSMFKKVEASKKSDDVIDVEVKIKPLRP